MRHCATQFLQIWDGITVEEINQYICRMPQVVHDVIQARGGQTRYYYVDMIKVLKNYKIRRKKGYVPLLFVTTSAARACFF